MGLAPQKGLQAFNKALHPDYSQSSWMDGTNCGIRLVRASTLSEPTKCISELTDEDFECEAGNWSP